MPEPYIAYGAVLTRQGAQHFERLEARVAELQAALESIHDNSRDVEAVSIAASALGLADATDLTDPEPSHNPFPEGHDMHPIAEHHLRMKGVTSQLATNTVLQVKAHDDAALAAHPPTDSSGPDAG